MYLRTYLVKVAERAALAPPLPPAESAAALAGAEESACIVS